MLEVIANYKAMRQVQPMTQALINLASVCSVENDFPNAIKYSIDALNLAKQVRDREGESSCLMNIADIDIEAGLNDDAIRYLDQSLPILMQMKLKPSIRDAYLFYYTAYKNK